MTGQLLADDGSGSASPAYAFDQDSDTGMFRAAANRIGFSTAGVNRVVITDEGNVSDMSEVSAGGFIAIVLLAPESSSLISDPF